MPNPGAKVVSRETGWLITMDGRKKIWYNTRAKESL
jgi:hypothetical protein